MKSMYLFYVFLLDFILLRHGLTHTSETIYPVENKDDWVVPDDIKQIKMLKQPYHPKARRLKANRRLS